MKRWMWFSTMLIALVLLSGCALGSRRDRNTLPSAPETAPATATAVSAEPAVPTEIPAPAATAENATQPPADTAGAATGDALEQQLLDQLNALDAANQAGDTLDDLP